jgi:hypothetical protein
VFSALPPRAVPYGFPVFVSPGDRRRVAADLAAHGLPLVQWPDLPSALSAVPDHYRQIQVVPFLW